MGMPAPAQVGMALGEVDTPALIIDLDSYEGNLRRMADAAKMAGVRLRPHGKTHKSPIIGRHQIEGGAVGLCCQKVAEAEIFVAAGIDDVLVSNEVVGAGKLDRLARLARTARIGVCADNIENIREIAAAAERADAKLSVLVEIDIGGRRCGVPPGEPALRLATAIAQSNALQFGGLQAYHGAAQHIRAYAERADAIARATARTHETVASLERAGLRCATIGGAGTGTFEFESASGVFNEIQPGSYIFMDADYVRNRNAAGGAFDTFAPALFVYTTVMSRPGNEYAVADAGHKAAAVDSGMSVPFNRPGLEYQRPSDEHGVLVCGSNGRLPELGEKVLLVPGHCDPTVNLHDWYVAVRGIAGGMPRVEAVWPIAARGALF
jgi:3-hydroxy-D-aspartate aldolase